MLPADIASYGSNQRLASMAYKVAMFFHTYGLTSVGIDHSQNI